MDVVEKKEKVWNIKIPFGLLIKYGIYSVENDKVQFSDASDINWIYSEWEKVAKSKKRPKFLLRTMHSFLIIKIFIYTFLIVVLPVSLLSLTNISMLYSIVNYFYFVGLLVGITSSWLMSVKYYRTMLKSYKMENVLKEIFDLKLKFEPNFWLVLGTIILSQSKKVHRNDLKEKIGCTTKGIEDILKRWSKMNVLDYSEDKDVTLNKIEIDMDYGDIKIKDKYKEKIKIQTRSLIFIRAILESLRK